MPSDHNSHLYRAMFKNQIFDIESQLQKLNCSTLLLLTVTIGSQFAPIQSHFYKPDFWHWKPIAKTKLFNPPFTYNSEFKSKIRLTSCILGLNFMSDLAQVGEGRYIASWNILVIVIVITFYSPTWLGQETAKGPFGLWVKLPPAHLSTTHGGSFTLSLYSLNVKQGSCEYQFLWSLVWPDRESNRSLPLQ